MFPQLYDELRTLAAARLRHLPPGLTLQATAVVHEAWMDLAGGGERGWECRAHFFGAAACAIREVIVDAARHRLRLKRGGGMKRVELHADIAITNELPGDPETLLRLHDALCELEDEHPQRAEIVRLYWFAGLRHETIAEVLQTSVRTVERRWRFSRAWLHDRLAAPPPVAAPDCDEVRRESSIR